MVSFYFPIHQVLSETKFAEKRKNLLRCGISSFLFRMEANTLSIELPPLKM